jgi:antitoxin (DNA-binding transcriptional repressor) of toxin-antitoxin stability system
MSDIIVSIAEFKTHLSRLLSESRNNGERIVIMNRKKPVATVVPYIDGPQIAQPGLGGLASLAGTWKELEEISSNIDEAFQSRKEGIDITQS